MKILAMGAHPDDIEAQIGGTLAKLSSEGAEILLVAATATSTGALSSESRDAEARRAAKCIGSNFLSLGISPDEFAYSRKYISIFDDLFILRDQIWFSLLIQWIVITSINLLLSVLVRHQERIHFL